MAAQFCVRLQFQALLVVVFLLPITSHAAAVPAYSPRFGQATSSLIGQKVIARGFAANDPRYAATVSGVGAVVTTIAGGLAAGVSWPAVLAAAGISSIASIAVPLLFDKAINWLWGSGDQAKVSGSDMQTTVQPATMPSTWPDIWTDTGAGNIKWYWNSSTNKWREVWAFQMAPSQLSWPTCIAAPGSAAAKSGACPDTANGYWSRQWTAYVDANTAKGVYEWIPATGQTLSPAYTPAFKPTSQIIGDLPQAVTSSQLSNEALASAANAQWQAASLQPNYPGLPYDATNPITAQDVATWRAANPSVVPTLNDFISPAVNPTTSKVDTAAPVTNPNASNSASTGTAVNLGTDPGITAPTLDTPPDDLFKPISDVMQPWLSWQVPDHAGVCPTWQASPSIAGYTFNIDISYQCTFIEQFRTVIAVSAIACWVVIAAFILLSA
jgi:hypothetical protein